ncbi:MAG: MBOAT family protein [Anaerolineae bacterium]|nr:MBOAT family protein [Anaerolineae bacterium]
MVFSSVEFLFFFLPAALFAYFIVPYRLKNIILLIFSLVFYTWGELQYTVIILLSIASNYAFGLLTAKTSHKKRMLFLTVLVNLSLLGFFKYANFLIETINPLLVNTRLQPIPNTPIHLPIGISFFTFQALSYVIDVYRGTTKAQKNILDLGLFIALFPQLVAGPIVRYKDIAEQLVYRVISQAKFAEGIRRFAIGMGKKVLIANNMGLVADTIFVLTYNQLSTSLAWIGIIAYSLQIYFDFSGYSDMAIGLGKMFGFDFLENFNYPYVAQSVQEFWRRWHISLSNWFRDYLYIPLGGNRKGPIRTYFNLYIVFFMTGLWHGASWNFVFWGLWHGTFLVIERLGFGKVLKRMWWPLRHFYTLAVVVLGWVFFRAVDFAHAWNYLNRMFVWDEGNHYRNLGIIMNNKLWLVLVVGIVFSFPIFSAEVWDNLLLHRHVKVWVPAVSTIVILIIFFLSIMSLASSSYNPFIYFRF